jgi:hypothetical protein
MNFDALGQDGPKVTVLGKEYVLHSIGRHEFLGFLSENGKNGELLIEWSGNAPESVKRLSMGGYDVKLKPYEAKSYLSVSHGRSTRRGIAFRNAVDFLMREFEQSAKDDPSWKIAQDALAELRKENSLKPNEGLNREEIVGLYGELYFLRTFLIAKGATAKRALDVWKGWDAGPQDFVDIHWIAEIKTSFSQKVKEFWINGKSQLSGAPGKAFFLCHIHFDSSQIGSQTLSGLVAELKETLADVQLVEVFTRRLEQVGYDETLAVDYDHYKFPKSGDVKFYDVNRDGFPRIASVVGEDRIREVKYKVHVRDLTEFVVPKISWISLFVTAE